MPIRTAQTWLLDSVIATLGTVHRTNAAPDETNSQVGEQRLIIISASPV